MAAARYTKVIKLVREAEDLARSGALVLDDGAGAIYFLWGQPSHAYMQLSGQRVEGDAALKEIALALAKPGKVSWKSKDVMQVETLRCNAEELIGVLEAMSTAGISPPEPLPEPPPPAPPAAAPSPPPRQWDGDERRRGPALRYSLTEFPLLPSGPSLWAEVPTSVVHLDVLIGTLQNVLVVFEAPSIRAAGVVCDGERYDAIYIDAEGVKTGRVAWELMIAQREGSVSAYEIEPDLARTLPVLWRNRVVHRDLDKTWINTSDFLTAQRGNDEDRAVIVATPDAIGIALFAQGHAVAAYTTDSRLPRYDMEEIQAMLVDDGEGQVSVLERLADDVGDSYIGRTPDESPLDEDEDLEAVAEAFSFQPLDDSFSPVETEAEDAAAEAPAEPEAPVAEDVFLEADDAGDQTEIPVEAEPPADADVASEADAIEAEPPDAAADADEASWDIPDAEAETPANGSAPPEEVSESGEPETEADAVESVADLPAPLPMVPNESLPFMAPGAGVGINDFASLLQGGAPPAPVEQTAASRRENGAAGRDEGLLGVYEAPTRHLDTTAAEPEAPPAPPDFDVVVAELLKIGERFLGENFGSVEALIAEAPKTPAGIRGAISAIRRAEIPNQSADEIQAVARAMTLYVADRVSAM